MTRLLLLFALSLAALLPVSADEVALMQVRFGKEKILRSVAFEFFEGDAPVTVENFKKLARSGFYKGLTFHRVFPDTLVQVGDPQSSGRDKARVGTAGPGYTLPPEIRRSHTAGAMAMARLPDKLNPSRLSNGSQFYVCLQPMPALDREHTVFGQVLYGMETLQQISNQAADSNDSPVTRIQVRSLRVMPRELLPPAPDPNAKPAVKKPWYRIF